MFGHRGATKGLKSRPCLEQKYSKNTTLCRTTPSILRPCLGHKIQTLSFYREIDKLSVFLIVCKTDPVTELSRVLIASASSRKAKIKDSSTRLEKT